MMAPPRKKSSTALLWLAVVPVMILSFLAVRMLGGGKDYAPLDDGKNSAFNLDEAPRQDPKRPGEGYRSKFEAERDRRFSGVGDGAGLAGFVTETGKAFKRPQGKLTPAQQEREWLRKHGHLIRREERRLLPITRKYRKKYKIVRDVDRAFGRMPRYMAVKRQYHKDGNPYKFVRKAVGLPEVRKAVMKYSTDPKVWRVSVQMMDEAMRKPPPKVLKDEITRFMTQDKKVKTFVGDFAEAIVPRLGKMMRSAVPPGMNLGPLQEIAGGIYPAGEHAAARGKTSRRRRAR